MLDRRFDLVVCLEVAEHIEPEYVDIFLNNLCSLSNQVLMSFAPPGAGGHYHVNCQGAIYWIEKMAERGYTLDLDIVKAVQSGLEPVKHKREIRSYYNHLLFFRRVS